MKTFNEQTRATVRLAIPIVFTQMGQMLMGIVDVFMVGKLGPQAIGAVAVGSALFFAICMFGFGLLSSLDFYISKSRGENDQKAVHLWKTNGLYFSFIVSAPLTVVILACSNNLRFFGVPESTAIQTHLFLKIFGLSVLPLLVFHAQRLILQSLGNAKFVTWVIIGANLANLLFNWIFIYGRWGFPALGIQGSALSTLVTRILMCMALFYKTYTLQSEPFEKINWTYIKNLWRLGLPAAFQGTFEVAIFSLSTAFASRLDPLSLAAHSIVLNIASFTFMVPLGISLAGAIRVGFFFGEKQYQQSKQAGWNALVLGAGFMALSGVIMFLAGDHLIGIFTQDAGVIAIAAKIILLAAVFQIADGVQVVATGVLRGIGNTKASAVANLVSYWVVALPIGYYLCFGIQWGLVGLWIGLTVGLVLVAASLLLIWRRKSYILAKTQTMT